MNLIKAKRVIFNDFNSFNKLDLTENQIFVLKKLLKAKATCLSHEIRGYKGLPMVNHHNRVEFREELFKYIKNL